MLDLQVSINSLAFARVSGVSVICVDVNKISRNRIGLRRFGVFRLRNPFPPQVNRD